jgi:hypothetical protein
MHRPHSNFIEGQCVRVYHYFQLLVLKSKQTIFNFSTAFNLEIKADFTGILCNILRELGLSQKMLIYLCFWGSTDFVDWK